MEDQGKRLLLSVAIAFGLMMIWQKLFPPEQVVQPPVAPAADIQKVPTDGVAPYALANEAVIPLGEEVFYDFEFENFALRFSSHGASISSFKLNGDKFIDRETKSGEELVRVNGQKLFGVDFYNSTFSLPDETEWTGEKISDKDIRFTWSNDDLKVVKLFKIHPENYSIDLLVDIETQKNRARQTLRVHTSSFQDTTEDTGGGMSRVEREWKASCYVDGDLESLSSTDLSKEGGKSWGGQVLWAGFVHAYFLVAVVPSSTSGRRIGCNVDPMKDPTGGMAMTLLFPEVEIEPNAPATEKMTLFLGPKYLDLLDGIDKQKGSDRGMLSKAVDLGFLGFIAGPLLAMLKWIYGFVGNWGIAIILLTFVVKAVTLPWVHRSMKSMQAMAALRPQMDKVKEKYKDDPKRQQMETMNLLKANNVSFFSGCLPMILQMPIWFAFYRALMVATELYQAKFLWVSDLTLPDPLYIMPVAVTAMMFLQTRLTPQTGTGMQQKMMTIGMPLMFGAFSFVFPAGLTLYIFTNTVLTAIHHLFMHKDKRREAAEAKKSAKNSAVIDVEATTTNEKNTSSKKSKKKNRDNK